MLDRSSQKNCNIRGGKKKTLMDKRAQLNAINHHSSFNISVYRNMYRENVRDENNYTKRNRGDRGTKE